MLDDAPSLDLTPQQREAVETLVARLVAGEKLLALRGLAGTGKTSIIPAIAAALDARGLLTTIAAPTHRAAHILRTKGLDADTVHHQALVTYFTADYRQACLWLGENLPVLPTDSTVAHEDVEGLPWLIYEAVQPNLDVGRHLRRRKSYKARRLLTSVGIPLRSYIAGHGPKTGPGILIVDEASMVGESMLKDCQNAFPQILLVGDHGQLPPVNDAPIFEAVPGVELTEIHRQAADSPILQLAYAARRGEDFWETIDDTGLSVGAPVRMVEEVAASRLRTSPLLVWRNETRIAATRAIRKALRYKPSILMPGEPLVCRETDPEDRALGFFNNALFRIVAVDPDQPRRITVQDEVGEQTTIEAHLEELDGPRPDPRCVPFRFGYVYTVHTAQGGAWPRLYLSLKSLLAYKRAYPKDFARWSYTAVTRAQTTLRLLTNHVFTAHHEHFDAEHEEDAMPQTPQTPSFTPSAAELSIFGPDQADPLAEPPSLVVPALPPAEQSPIPLLEDDLADPAVPATLQTALKGPESPGEALWPQDTPVAMPSPVAATFGQHEALLHGFLAALQKPLREALLAEIRHFGETADATFLALRQWVDTAGQPNEHAQYQLSAAVHALQTQGLSLRHDPYEATVQAVSPDGFPVAIRILKGDTDALITALPVLLAWLGAQGFQPAPTAAAALA